MTPAGILLVPGDGDPHELLKQGVDGSRPPVASKLRYAEPWMLMPAPGEWGWIGERKALVLRWKGENAVDGLLQATWRATNTPALLRGLLTGERPVEALVRVWVEHLGCQVIYLDADCREVRP